MDMMGDLDPAQHNGATPPDNLSAQGSARTGEGSVASQEKHSDTRPQGGVEPQQPDRITGHEHGYVEEEGSLPRQGGTAQQRWGSDDAVCLTWTLVHRYQCAKPNLNQSVRMRSSRS